MHVSAKFCAKTIFHAAGVAGDGAQQVAGGTAAFLPAAGNGPASARTQPGVRGCPAGSPPACRRAPPLCYICRHRLPGIPRPAGRCEPCLLFWVIHRIANLHHRQEGQQLADVKSWERAKGESFVCTIYRRPLPATFHHVPGQIKQVASILALSAYRPTIVLAEQEGIPLIPDRCRQRSAVVRMLLRLTWSVTWAPCLLQASQPARRVCLAALS